ncbi:MAG: hypothetical protein DRR19_25100, partial [Candidatus Parabeggiatoa sp. nov. 1]
MNRFNETLTELNEALAQNPNDIKALAHRGETYRLRGHYEKALADFNRVIELNSDYTWALAHRGETYCLMERYKEAIADFDDSVKLKQDYAWAIAHRGACYQKLNRYDKAQLDLDQAIELNPNYAWAYASRSHNYKQLTRYEQALADFDQAIALDKSIFSAWHSDRGMLLNYGGQYSRAIEFCEQWLNKDNEETHLLLYNIAVAKTCLQGLAQTQPQIDKARTALQSLVQKDTTGAVLYRLGGLAALEK